MNRIYRKQMVLKTNGSLKKGDRLHVGIDGRLSSTGHPLGEEYKLIELDEKECIALVSLPGEVPLFDV